jgi:hypothetical protein
MPKHAGFILEPLLITLAVLALLSPLAVTQLRLLLRTLSFPEDLQDRTGLAQLRRLINVSDDFQVSEQQISLRYNGQTMVLHLVGENLILQPGTQFFLTRVDEIHFAVKGAVLEVCYERKDKQSCACLGLVE